MNNRKAVICTIIFSVLVIIISVALFFIKPHNSEISLFFIISPAIVGLWTGERIEKFYNWLIKEDN